MEEKKKRLQENLQLLRSCAGWSADVLGEKIGVTRQMVSNLEGGRTMTQMQFLAISQVIEREIIDSGEEQGMLATVYDALVLHPQHYQQEEVDAIVENARLLIPAVLKRPQERTKISVAWKAIVLSSTVIVGAALMHIFKSKEDSENEPQREKRA